MQCNRSLSRLDQCLEWCEINWYYVLTLANYRTALTQALQSLTVQCIESSSLWNPCET